MFLFHIDMKLAFSLTGLYVEGDSFWQSDVSHLIVTHEVHNAVP